MPRESKILHGNINRNTNIQSLQAQWPCGKSGCGTYCFVNGQREHIMLSHEKIEVWATAMVSHKHCVPCAISKLMHFSVERRPVRYP